MVYAIIAWRYKDMEIELTEDEAQEISFLLLRHYPDGPIGLLVAKLTEESEIILKIGDQT